MRIQRGFKVKIYPTPEQEQQLLRTAGACRWIYNHYLEERTNYYLEHQKTLTYKEMSANMTRLRKELEWLSDTRLQTLQQSLRQLEDAYKRFFRNDSKFPKFKNKYGNQSFRKVTGWSVNNNKLFIMEGLTVSFRGKLPISREGTLTISRDKTGSWFASAQGFEERNQPKLNGSIGLDFGLKNLVITSNGEKFNNIRSLDGLTVQIRSAQKALSRKQKGSNNRAKAKLALARLHKKVESKRTNHLHHVSKAIVGKNQATIVVEDLAIQNMMKNRRLARTIGDAGWGDLLRMVTYKQEWAGGKVIKINRFFPSSKTCSECNFVRKDMSLSVRNWLCPSCGIEHDRDINAALNILKQGVERLGVEKKALALASAKVKLSSVKHGNEQIALG